MKNPMAVTGSQGDGLSSDKNHHPVDLDTIDMLLKRCIDRRVRGGKPQAVALPESKKEFPKLLCLDENIWVYLSRAYYNRPDSIAYRPALEAVKKATAAQKLIVPVTGANAREMMKRKNPDSRRRLAEFMVALSGNHSMLHDLMLTELEMIAAVSRHFDTGLGTPAVRGRLVQRGMHWAVAGKMFRYKANNPRYTAVMTDVMYEPEMSVEALTNFISRGSIHDMRKRDEDLAVSLDRIRRNDVHLAIPNRRRLELSNLVRIGPWADQLRGVLDRLRVDTDRFYCWLWTDDNFDHFVEELPNIAVKAALLLHRDRNIDHATDKNDREDMAFLDVAIPYANIVVTERSWASYAKATGLTRKYGTTVIADVTKLPAILDAEGCV